jgi:hypothetical protein
VPRIRRRLACRGQLGQGLQSRGADLLDQAVGTSPSAALVYAINRCTSADSLEYVKSAS